MPRLVNQLPKYVDDAQATMNRFRTETRQNLREPIQAILDRRAAQATTQPSTTQPQPSPKPKPKRAKRQWPMAEKICGLDLLRHLDGTFALADGSRRFANLREVFAYLDEREEIAVRLRERRIEQAVPDLEAK